jgi:hypothetical protein
MSTKPTIKTINENFRDIAEDQNVKKGTDSYTNLAHEELPRYKEQRNDVQFDVDKEKFVKKQK